MDGLQFEHHCAELLRYRVSIKLLSLKAAVIRVDISRTEKME